MWQPKNPKQAEEWQARIDAWQQSGKTMIAWCKEHQVSEHQFWYWKDRLLSKKESSRPSRFVELLDDSPSEGGVAIQFQDFTIQLTTKFDENTLRRCLLTLRELS